MASYDRAITSEPSFKADQAEGLLKDLTDYLRVLKVFLNSLSRLVSESKIGRLMAASVSRRCLSLQDDMHLHRT